MSRSIALWVCLAALLLPPTTAGAGGTEDEAGGWKVIAGDGTYADSECIGSNETPECYGDTMIACGMWHEPRTAARAGQHRLYTLCEDYEFFRDEFYPGELFRDGLTSDPKPVRVGLLSPGYLDLKRGGHPLARRLALQDLAARRHGGRYSGKHLLRSAGCIAMPGRP